LRCHSAHFNAQSVFVFLLGRKGICRRLRYHRRARSRCASFSISLKLKQQAADDIALLHRMAEGGNETEARRAYEESIKRLNQLTQDMRNVELGAANQAARTINQLAPQAQQRQASMVNALRGGIPVGEALPGQAVISPITEAAQQAATAAKGKPGFLSAGDCSQEWQQTSDIFADIAKQRRAEAGFLERQIGSLEDYGLQGRRHRQ